MYNICVDKHTCNIYRYSIFITLFHVYNVRHEIMFYYHDYVVVCVWCIMCQCRICSFYIGTKQTAFQILNIICLMLSWFYLYQILTVSNTWFSFDFVVVSRCSIKCKHMATILTQSPITLLWSRVSLVWI